MARTSIFLGVLFVVWGLLTIAGRRVDAGARRRRGRADHVGRPRRRQQVAAGLTAAAFTTLALIAILWGAAHIVVGVPLRRRRRGRASSR